MDSNAEWTASQVRQGKDVVSALMQDPANGIVFVLAGGAPPVEVGLRPEVYDASRVRVEQTLSTLGLTGIATFAVSAGLVFE